MTFISYFNSFPTETYSIDISQFTIQSLLVGISIIHPFKQLLQQPSWPDIFYYLLIIKGQL